MQMRIRDLIAVHKFRQEHKSPKSPKSICTLIESVEDIRALDRRYFPPSKGPSRLQNLTDNEVHKQAGQAQDWLFDLLDYHNMVFDRAHHLRTFRSAIGKEMAGQQERWSEKERLYMALTDPTISSPGYRLKFAHILVLQLNLAERLQDVSNFISVRMERIQHAKELDSDLGSTQEAIVDKITSIKVDHFACAVPLSSLQPSAGASMVDQNAGSCPVCQNSYTDLSKFKIQDLIADYPVRIKYCGHILGKCCLEQWMVTRKIDPAKYPHRTCPLCRVQLEGVRAPPMPRLLKQHLKSDRRAMETVQDLKYGFELEPEDCHDAVAACLSMSIACNELLAMIRGQKSDERNASSDEDEKILVERLEEVKKEMRAWGFRGKAAWKDICKEWRDSGVVRKE